MFFGHKKVVTCLISVRYLSIDVFVMSKLEKDTYIFKRYRSYRFTNEHKFWEFTNQEFYTF